jgi:hypothetical protein
LITTALRQLEREIDRLKKRIGREADRFAGIQELTVPDAARLLKKTPRWVRANLPVVVYSKRSHHVRLADIETFQARRILEPSRDRQCKQQSLVLKYQPKKSTKKYQ